MKLILTGHDYAGKSTVLNELWRYNNNGKMSYIHLSYREPTDKNFYDRTLDFSNFLMDRCFLDELIYPTVFGRQPSLTFEDVGELVDKCRDNDIKLVVLECDNEEILRRIKMRKDIEEEPEVLANIYQIKRMYEQLTDDFGIPRVNTTGKTTSEIIMEIDSLGKSKQFHINK